MRIIRMLIDIVSGLGKAVKTFGQDRFNKILVELNERVGG